MYLGCSTTSACTIPAKRARNAKKYEKKDKAPAATGDKNKSGDKPVAKAKGQAEPPAKRRRTAQ